MGKLQKLLLVLFFGGSLTVIITTWGSIGSIILTLGLLLAAGILLLRHFWDTHDPEDYWPAD